MNRSSFALLVALLIHLLFLLLFWVLVNITPEFESQTKEEKKIKISLKELPKKYKESGVTKKKVEPTPMAPPMPKGGQLEKIVKKPPIVYEPPKKNEKPKEPTINKTQKKPEKKELKKPKEEQLQKPFITLNEVKSEQNTTKEKLDEKKEDKAKEALYALLSQDKSSQQQKVQKKRDTSGSSINQNIKDLYGTTFGELSPGQQQYILDNQETMRRITQQVLTRVARVNLPRDLNVNRTNVIEFYLHPNGDMSDFKFLQKSGYYILDDTTRETIEYAYSRYPRPKEKTLIRYNVFYNLASY